MAQWLEAQWLEAPTLITWIERHPLILLYLVGCVLVVALTVFKVILFRVIDWVIRANVLKRNLTKVLPPDEKTFGEKAARSLMTFTVEALLSWINVIVILWQIVVTSIRVARDLLQPVPEEIKILRFPLRNNPDMPRESVWAYLHALGVKAGEKSPDKAALLQSLNEIANYYPSFDRLAALRQLERLKAINPDIIAASLASAQESRRGT